MVRFALRAALSSTPHAPERREAQFTWLPAVSRGGPADAERSTSLRHRHYGNRGTALYSDDLAADLRGEFRDLIGEGLSSTEAVDRLRRNTRRRSVILMRRQSSG